MTIRKILATSLVATLSLTSCDNSEQTAKQDPQKAKTTSKYTKEKTYSLRGTDLEVLTRGMLDYCVKNRALMWQDYWGTDFPLKPADKYIVNEDKGEVYALGFDPFGRTEFAGIEGKEPVYRLIELIFVKQGTEWVFKELNTYKRKEILGLRSTLNELINLNE